MNQAAAVIVVFGVVSVVFLGFFLIVPQMYSRLDVTDLGAVGNSTLDDAYGVAETVQNLNGALVIAIAVIALVAAVVLAFARWR